MGKLQRRKKKLILIILKQITLSSTYGLYIEEELGIFPCSKAYIWRESSEFSEVPEPIIYKPVLRTFQVREPICRPEAGIFPSPGAFI